MQQSASVALTFNSSGRTTAKALATRPVAPVINIVRLSPASVSIKSELLFDPGRDATVREFLIRVFGVEEVDAVTFRRRQGRVDVRLAPTAIASKAWPKLAAALRGARGHDTATRDLLEHRVASLQLAETVAETAVRVTRLGNVLTTWRVTRHSHNRLRFSHPALRRRRDVLHRFRMELSSIYGVEALSTNVLTASVWVNFDPELINPEQLVNGVERFWPILLDETTPPLSSRKLIIAGALLGFGFTAQFLRYSLRPYAVAAVVLYGFSNVIQAVRDLTQGKVGLPLLYTTITTMVVMSGNPFPSSVMAVFMQSWPRLSERVAIGYDRRLFANSRRRFVWVRTSQNDGAEIRIDIDRLAAGDVFHLQAGDYIPVDGVVAEGFGAVDEDMLTGVMGAIDKSPGDPVYASTYLRTGTLAVRVLRDAGASAANVIAASLPIGPIARLPSSAEVERVANRNAKPAIAAAVLNLAATGTLTVSQGLIRADYATAPRLSAQLSTVTGIAEGLRQGIFLRKPSALDRLLGSFVYVFDDSAGLERSQVAVAASVTTGDEDARTVLSIATAAFARRGDARAKALLGESARRQIALPQVQRRRRVAGAIRFVDEFGALVEVATTAYVDLAALVIPDALAPSLAEAGVALDPALEPRDPDIRPLWVARAGRVIGVIAFERREPFGASVVETLRARNPNNRYVYVSSAPQAKARAIAKDAGIETAIGGLDAAAKANTIRELSRRAIWIGDGSAPQAQPSITASAVSVSVGGVATLLDDTADVILLQSDLDGLITVRKLARAHLARLRADTRTVYTANLLGTAGAFVAGFGSLEANLTTNFGSGLVLASRWRDLRSLARAFEYRDFVRLSALTEELDIEHIGAISKERREEEFVEFPDPIDAPPPIDGV
jgi:cation transport ATPase